MKKSVLGIVVFAAVLAVGFVLLSTGSKVQSAVITVQGMRCDDCAEKITSALQKQEGVQQAEVSLADGAAKVSYDTKVTSLASLEQTIANLGYSTPNVNAAAEVEKSRAGCDTEAKNAGDGCCAAKAKSI